MANLPEFITHAIHDIGHTAPILLFFITICILYINHHHSLLTLYGIGMIVNIAMNILLKAIIQSPRPSETTHNFYNLKLSDRFINANKYGMPSGHAQSTFFSTTFIYLATKNHIFTIMYLLISIVSLYQRVVYQYHTIIQIAVGSILGFATSYATYQYAQSYLKGTTRTKPDDNAMILT
jgi:membrane-associated phospholipid phosphatase